MESKIPDYSYYEQYAAHNLDSAKGVEDIMKKVLERCRKASRSRELVFDGAPVRRSRPMKILLLGFPRSGTSCKSDRSVEAKVGVLQLLKSDFHLRNHEQLQAQLCHYLDSARMAFPNGSLATDTCTPGLQRCKLSSEARGRSGVGMSSTS